MFISWIIVIGAAAATSGEKLIMTTRDNHPLFAAINAKLAAIAAASSTPPAWHEAWSRLGPESTKEERLEVYRAIRAAGSVPPEAGFFLVAWMMDLLTDDRAEEGLRVAEERLEAIRQKYGLDEEVSIESSAVPPEYRDAMEQVDNAWDALYAATLEEFGEQEMDRLFRADRQHFDQRYETGRQFFHGPDRDDDPQDDDWLALVHDAVSACVEAESPMGPLGLRYREEEGFWEIWVYPTPVELVGGRHDGEVVVPGFSLDLDQLRAAFDSVVAFGWNALGLNHSEGPHISVEGAYQGREVYLQVLAQPPEDEEPGMKFDTTRRPHHPQ
jgi:hypothetical protein